MELMHEADTIVRHLIPTVLESTGEAEEANRLRNHSKLNNKTAKSACRLLSTIYVNRAQLKHLVFWTEALVRAALRGDASNFALYVDQVTKMLDSELVRRSVMN